MSILSPKEIYGDFKKRNLDKSKASELLISVIENPLEVDTHTRISSVKFLGLIGSKEEKIYFFLENLLISDFNDLIRGNAASIIIRNFPDEALKPIQWALKHETSETSIILIIRALEKSDNKQLKLLLKTLKYIKFKDKFVFPFGSDPIINLSSNNIEKISEIKGLDNLSNLNKLYLDFNRINEIEGLNNLNNLKSLHFQWNKIGKIEGLNNLTKLEYLYLNNNEIDKIQGIQNLQNLKSLMIYDNQITEIENIEHLSNLEILNLRNNGIKEIKGLDYLKNLKRLDLSNNRIKEIKGLDNLVNLEFLDLSYNQISEIKGLDKLKKLKFLDLRNNKIKTIKQLNILKKLQHLYLGFNRISINEDSKNRNIINDLEIKENSISNSLFDFFYSYKVRSKPVNKRDLEIIDIKFMPELFKAPSLLKELKLSKHPLSLFTRSSWAVILKNNEYEIFQFSKFGEVTWIQRRRNQYFAE
jgi:Leucine-rich repeat (LRR) protein